MIRKISDLSEYGIVDAEKLMIMEDVRHRFLEPPHKLAVFNNIVEIDESVNEKCLYNDSYFEEEVFTKYCPECGEKYPESENVCMECLVHLKKLSDKKDVIDIEFSPQFIFEGVNNYDDFKTLLSEDNLSKISQFDFSYDDYLSVLHDIKSQAFRNFDELVKSEELDFDALFILDKIIVFAKSFVPIEYKSSGSQLGYFEEGIISIDDRQTKSLQITTLIHELSHFILQEILIQVLCRILDASKTDVFEDLSSFILNYTPFTQLIDEYAAHNVEGRFTLFGFQDYSSFITIQKSLDGQMNRDEIEVTKMIGNTFSVSIKEILEALIDRDLRDDIKEQFLNDVLDRPNYSAMLMENYHILNEEGFIKALKLILVEGCGEASVSINSSATNLSL